MGANRMTGTPWHVEVLHKSENDERRHKSRCIRYNGGYCTFYSDRCTGSSHCRYYQEVNDIPSNNAYKNQPQPNGKTIGLNSKVKIYDLSKKETFSCTLVEGNGDLSKASEFKISLDSALAQKLIGCNVGSTIVVNSYRYQVLWYSRDGCIYR